MTLVAVLSLAGFITGCTLIAGAEWRLQKRTSRHMGVTVSGIILILLGVRHYLTVFLSDFPSLGEIVGAFLVQILIAFVLLVAIQRGVRIVAGSPNAHD